MAITRVWVDEDCITCHSSVATCPAVFEISKATGRAAVRTDVDYSLHDSAIRKAADTCPVEAIGFEEDGA